MLSHILEAISPKAVALAVCGAAFAQAFATDLTQCLAVASWDTKKNGPLIVLEPDKVKSNKGESLADFKRKIVQIGSLHAVVPDTMEIFDESGLDKPDLYDGLPMYVKVMYLLTLLDKSQFNKVCQGGIGFSDLRDEQVRVFESILPKPFKWTSTSFAEKRRKTTNFTLSSADRSKVKLKLSKTLMFELYGQDGNSYSPMSIVGQNPDLKTENELDNSDQFDGASSFGVEVRKSVPNKLKPSELDYDSPALDKTIQLMPAEKTIDLLKRIEQATGRDLFADIRVANRIVVAKGEKAKASDILKALAQSVTGTYRKVGSLYLLTSDIAGLGSRAVKFFIWNRDISETTFIQLEKWRKALAGTGNINKAGFDSNDPYTPNDFMNQAMAARSDPSRPSRPAVNIEDLPKAHQALLKDMFETYGNQWRHDKVDFTTEISFGFVLPDGTKLSPERHSLGQTEMLSQDRSVPEESGNQPQLKPVDLSDTITRIPILLRAQSSRDALKRLQVAKGFGFKEIWLETRAQDALAATVKAAKQLAIDLKLVIEPLNSYGDGNPANEDLTILGDNGDEARKRANKMVSQVPSHYAVSISQSHRVVNLTQFSAPSWRNRFVNLAKTEGLSGVVVLGTQPAGYQKLSPYSDWSERKAVFYLGYSSPEREDIIRAKSIDPIDVPPDRVMLSIDLRPPFFLDDLLRSGSSRFDGHDDPLPEIAAFPAKYREELENRNRSAMEQFLNDLATVGQPLEVECRVQGQSFGTDIQMMKAWSSGMKIGQIEYELSNSSLEPEGMILQLPETQNSVILWTRLLGFGSKPAGKGYAAINALSVPLANLEAVLSRLFVPVK